MARYGGFRRSPAVFPAEDASMVSELHFVAATPAHDDDFWCDRFHSKKDRWADDLGSDFRNWEWDPGDDDNPYLNRNSKLQLDEREGRASLLEGKYAAPISAPRSFDARFDRIQEPEFKNQEVGSRFCGNFWREASIQDDDDGKIDGRRVFDEKFQRVTYMDDDQRAEFRNDIIKIFERKFYGIKINGLRDLWDALDDEHDEHDTPPCNLIGRAATIQDDDDEQYADSVSKAIAVKYEEERSAREAVAESSSVTIVPQERIQGSDPENNMKLTLSTGEGPNCREESWKSYIRTQSGPATQTLSV